MRVAHRGIGCLSVQSKAGLSRSSAFLAARYGGWVRFSDKAEDDGSLSRALVALREN